MSRQLYPQDASLFQLGLGTCFPFNGPMVFRFSSSLNEGLFLIRLNYDCRKAVSLEVYQTLILRDVYAETLRDGSDWQLNLRMHCETAQVGIPSSGSWTIRLIDTNGGLVHQLVADSLISGDQERKATVHFQLKIAANQVRLNLKYSILSYS